MSGNFRFTLVLAAIALAAVSACNSQDEPPGPLFEDAWVRPLPPGMKMTAGFGKLHNPSNMPLEFVSYSSPGFGEVSLHRTEVVDGMSRMREVDILALGPGESVELAPGGYHFMLMMPTAQIEPGQSVSLQLTAADGRTFSFELPVERR